MRFIVLKASEKSWTYMYLPSKCTWWHIGDWLKASNHKNTKIKMQHTCTCAFCIDNTQWSTIAVILQPPASKAFLSFNFSRKRNTIQINSPFYICLALKEAFSTSFPFWDPWTCTSLQKDVHINVIQFWHRWYSRERV